MKRKTRHAFKTVAEPAALPTQESLIGEIRELGFKYIRDKDYTSAQFAFKKLLELNNKDVNARYVYAHLIDDGTAKGQATARDLMLSILDDNPVIFDHPTEANLEIIRSAADRCGNVGPFPRAIELFRKLAHASNRASDYARFSEVLTQGNFFEEAISSLEKAIALDPATYDTPANRETLEIASSRSSRAISEAATNRKKIGRYPETKEFLGDFHKLIKDHIAVNLNSEPKFLTRNTRFFTMGSCFASNLSDTLSRSGYTSRHMQISEYINTTFANKVFVDWLGGVDIDGALRDRIEELYGLRSRESTVEAIKNSDVFILTLGVAAAFFDRATGDLVLPRPGGLNSRALAEKYLFRTASVKENVENVLHVIEAIRKISPDIKVVITVSPVPMLASFEFESAVQADCLSKSTMRLVAHEVVNSSNLSNILYWPSFEIFRWAGSNASNYYAADDGAAWHVSEEKVAGTIKTFVEMFSLA